MLELGEKAIITKNQNRIGIIRHDRPNLFSINLDNGLVATIKGYEAAMSWARNEAD